MQRAALAPLGRFMAGRAPEDTTLLEVAAGTVRTAPCSQHARSAQQHAQQHACSAHARIAAAVAMFPGSFPHVH
jgi:hypothetical protein